MICALCLKFENKIEICQSVVMLYYVIRILFAALLFSSTYAAAESVCFELDEVQDTLNIILDQKNTNSNSDDQSDCCDYFCNCIMQLGLVITYTSKESQTPKFGQIPHYYRYLSQSAPPLLRPPIV